MGSAVPARKPKRIILVRHGESTGNADRSVMATVPDYALELTERGREQAEAAGREIAGIIGGPAPSDGGYRSLVRFYVSTHHRTRQTYEGILRALPVTPAELTKTYFDPRLREQDWGHLREPAAAMQLEAERNSYGAFHYRFPNGEACADVYDRLSTFLDTLHRDWEKGSPENNVIVTHGRTLRVFLMRWYKWRPEEFEAYANPHNCKVVVMQLNRATDRYDLITEMERYKPHDLAPRLRT